MGEGASLTWGPRRPPLHQRGASFALGPAGPSPYGRGGLFLFGTTGAPATSAKGLPSLSPRPPPHGRGGLLLFGPTEAPAAWARAPPSLWGHRDPRRMGEALSFALGPLRPTPHGQGGLLRFHRGPREGGRVRSLYATPPPPPRGLKDSGAGSATNKCPYWKPSAAEGANFFLHTMCSYSKCSKICREFIFVLK